MKLRKPRTRVQWTAVIAVGAVLAGAAFWIVAPYNIAASNPHLPGVNALLRGYLHNAVRTWSLGIAVPDHIDLDDPALIARGAGHFETGCAPCHGAPGRRRSPVVLGMRPEPPDLSAAAEGFRAHELYWIALNGFKYTGMPAWPAQLRPEEPWAMAAFLLRYPELDAAGYQELAYGAVDPRGSLSGAATGFGSAAGAVGGTVENCSRCHGRDGLGRGGVAPRLAGQSRAYLLQAIEAYADGSRPSGFMQPIAASLTDEEREEVARYFAELPRFAAAGGEPAAEPLIEAGARLAAGEGAANDVPSCLACHGPQAQPERRELYPHIAGQDRRWLETWLRLWREQALGSTPFADVMHEAARPLRDDQIEALAAFFAAGASAPSD